MPTRFDPEQLEEYRRHNRRVGSRIRDARIDNDMTQDDLGKIVNRPKAWLSAIESGRNGVSTMDLANIANATGRPVAYFFSDGAVTGPQFLQPETLADWLALYPGDAERATSHFQLDRIYKDSAEVIRAREKVRA